MSPDPFTPNDRPNERQSSHFRSHNMTNLARMAGDATNPSRSVRNCRFIQLGRKAIMLSFEVRNDPDRTAVHEGSRENAECGARTLLVLYGPPVVM